MLRVMLKLKRLKGDIKVWNKEIFGNVDTAISQLQRQLSDTQNRISESGYTDALFDEEVSIQANLNVTLSRKNSLLQQKSRISWLKDGDRNTGFFQRMTKFKKKNASISHLKIDGVDCYDSKVIEQHVVSHFADLFKDDGHPGADHLDIDALIDATITERQNFELVSIPQEYEIKATVFSMDANSAPGPDGFSGHFFHTCWDIIQDDVVGAIQAFFQYSYLPTGCNSSTMVLIPKKDTVSTVSNLRPIVLSNFFFKIMSKLLVARLSGIAATHVSSNQFGFISGRNIHDCIMLSSEGFNAMQRTNRGSNMACKVDIKKAFDTIRWEFIMQVLRANGYHETFINWISIIFKSARLSILYNGQLTGYFPCSRGVRQGDPLSPILFGIAEDVLSHLISSCVNSRHLVPMRFSRATNFPTHLFYADDIIIFCNATIRNACKLRQVLNYYEGMSGQKCSQEKSNVIFGKGVSIASKREIQRALGFMMGSLPMTYLGVPIFVGSPRASFIMPIYDRIVQKFARWKGLQLSIAGRLCLVQSVIQSSLVHSMKVYKWPRALLHSLDRKCQNFVWTGNVDQRPSCSIISSRYLTRFRYAKRTIANSSIWIGVKQEVNPLVLDSYSCIDNGANTLFWTDDWLGYKLVDRLRISHFMHEFLNFAVKDYFFDGKWHFSATFVNTFPDIVADILLVSFGDQKDRRFWKHSVKGEVTAALAFSNKCHRFPMVKWGKWIWEPFIPVRRSILCWRVLHGRLPTMDVLRRQGMIAPNGCHFCLADEESIDHIMWSCTKVSQIWNTLLDWFGKTELLSCIDITTFLVFAWNASFSSQILSLWKASIITVMWKIWDVRNSVVFEDTHFEARAVLAFVKAFLKELDSSFARMGTIRNTWGDYVIMRRIGVSSRRSPPPRMLEVHWWPPVGHWIKVNTDGSAKGAPGPIARGGVFRDKWNVVRGCFHIKGGRGKEINRLISWPTGIDKKVGGLLRLMRSSKRFLLCLMSGFLRGVGWAFGGAVVRSRAEVCGWRWRGFRLLVAVGLMMAWHKPFVEHLESVLCGREIKGPAAALRGRRSSSLLWFSLLLSFKGAVVFLEEVAVGLLMASLKPFVEPLASIICGREVKGIAAAMRGRRSSS
ncbi:uncharacterized protein LOC131025621 [Salvia miltiorrhiza]|uniref:uncharacterized protein LOC131025621 n=1 Tax=Salvia miltiorrhiza TaxID=226208 RepID=UPI0025AD4A8A|nr:uncharacterized protein LOC131025621 [Salvia miltiorrhiza]